MTLNVVVFPAPLGPISPVTYPVSASRSTPCTAWMPPKRTSTSLTRNTGKAVHLPTDDRLRLPSWQPRPEPLPQIAQLPGDAVGVAAEAHGTEAGEQVLQAPALQEVDVVLEDGIHGEHQDADGRARPGVNPANGDQQQQDQALQQLVVDRAG